MGVGELDEEGQNVPTSSYKINKSWGCNAQHGDYSYHCCMVCLKVAKTVNPKSLPQNNNNKTLFSLFFFFFGICMR